MCDDRQLGLGIIVLGLAALVSVRPLGGELGALERRCSERGFRARAAAAAAAAFSARESRA